MITGPAVTWCWVSDMPKSVAFYRDLLGATVDMESPYWSSLRIGTMKLGLHPMNGPATPGAYPGGWVLGLECDDLKGLKTAAEAAGAKIYEGYHQTSTGVVLTLSDPDGNAMQVIQPGSKMADFA